MGFIDLIEEAKKDGIQHLYIAAAPVFEHTIFLLKRSIAASTHPGFFVFPTSEYQDGESINQLLQKALLINAGLVLDSVQDYIGHFDYDGKRQCTFIVHVKDPYAVQLSSHEAYSWVPIREAIGYPISGEMRELLDRIIEKTNAP